MAELASESLGGFVGALQGLRTRAGNPTLDQLVRLTGQHGQPLARSTLHQKLRGETPPDWPFVEAFVRACSSHARQHRRQLSATDVDLGWWRDQHTRLTTTLAAARPGHRLARAAELQVADLFAAEREAYQRRLVERYVRLDLEILTPKEQDEHRRVLLRSVFVPQDVRPEGPAAELPKELLRLIEAGELRADDLPDVVSREQLSRTVAAVRQPARPVLQLLAAAGHRLIVILGDPGSGKSTLARYLMVALAGEQPDDALAPLAGWLPVLVELRSCAEPRWHAATFLDYLDHLHATEGLGLPKQALDSYLHADGRAVVVFDGLDELFDPAFRESVIRQIAAFAARYPQTRVVVTSRRFGYSNAVLAGARFAHHVLQDLDREQIEQFVDSWYELACPDDPAEAARRGRRLLAAVDASPSIRELAGNPLLLTILSIIGRRQELPRDRRSVYEHAAAVLVEHWDVERHLRDSRVDVDVSYIGSEDKLELLQRVARRMQDGDPGLRGNHIVGADLLTEFDTYLRERYQLPPVQTMPAARAMLDKFRVRNFILSHFGANVYGFVHRAFLEYFSAADIVHRFRDKREWTPDELVRDVFDRHWSDPAWTEVLLLVAGTIDERFTAIAIDHLLRVNPLWFLRPDDPPQNVFLAVRCLGEVRKLGVLAQRGNNVTDAVILLLETACFQWHDLNDYSTTLTLLAVIETALPVFKAVGARWPGRDRYWDWYRTRAWRRGSDASPYMSPIAEVAALILAAMHSGNGDVKETLRGQAAFGGPSIRRAAVAALAAGWGQDGDVRRLLRERVALDPDWYARFTALEALASEWPDDPDTLLMLRDRAVTDSNEYVQEAAMLALEAGWRNDSGMVQLLKDLTTHRGKRVRAAAVEALAGACPADPETGRRLRHLATTDIHQDVRQAAVEAVADGWQEHPDTGPWLRQRATADPHQDVRATAVEALAEGWRDDADIGAWLRQRATADPDEHVRQAATRAAAAVRREDADTPLWLREQAIGRYPSVRKAAVEALIAGWIDDPDTLPLLRERATTDTDKDVQCTTIMAIAERRPDDPDPAPLLTDLTTNTDKEVRTAALEALAAGWPEDPETGQRLRQLAATDVHPDVRQAAVQAIAADWRRSPDTGPWLRQRATHELHHEVRQAAVEAAAARWQHDPDTGPWLRQQATADPDETVQQIAVHALAVGWRQDPDNGPWLQRLATADLCPALRRAAVKALSDNCGGDPDVSAFLRARIATDPDEHVRAAAIDGLCDTWTDDPNTLTMLRDRATADPSELVRVATVEGLCMGWRDDPGTLPLLRERATADLHSDVRKAAVQILCVGWREDPGTLPLLRDRATTDSDQDVRRIAVEALAAAWRDDPGTLPLLRDLTRADPHQDVRKTAEAHLYSGWREVQLSLLRQIAVTDPDDDDREMAVELVAAAGREDHDTGQWLRDRATADVDQDVRIAAVEALCIGWRDDPGTLSVLRKIATADPHTDVRRAAGQALAILEIGEGSSAC